MSKTLVMKFGGTSVGSVDALISAVQIIRDAKRDWDRVVVVPSAMSGVTNLLLDSAASASQGTVDSLPEAEATLRQKHLAAADALIKDEKLREETKAGIDALILLLVNLCKAIAVLGEASPRALDAVASLGERDGNHSLATAKAIWERIKPEVGLDHPARYALVEIKNVHDEGLTFEPIHRVLFGLRKNIFSSLQHYYKENLTFTHLASIEEMIARVDHAPSGKQLVGVVSDGGWVSCGVLEIDHPTSNLAVGTLQTFLDQFLKENGADRIDYVHGKDVVCKLGAQPGNAGFYVPGIHKSGLFKTVILDGALPRKTFSMGEAKEKRFYMEARKIK